MNMEQIEEQKLNYEEKYHQERHKTHFNEKYYDARALIAKDKFFNDVPDNAKLLDYGCGLGQNIYYFKNAIGFDISRFGLDFCRSKGLKVTDNLYDIEDESMEYVFSSHVLEHHPHPKLMIEEMKSKLKKGCDLILIIPHERHGKSDFKLDLNQHLYAWNFRAINNLLITCGFKIKKNKYLRGIGYDKWLFLRGFSFSLYQFLTVLTSYLFGVKEMMIVATKDE